MDDENMAMMDENQPMMDGDKKEEEAKSATTYPDEEPEDGVSVARKIEGLESECCCCNCYCSNEYTSESRCCGCFPIKCGVLAIGIFTILLTIYLVTMNFFLILNDYVHWYFPFIILILLVPLIISSNFFVVFFTKDTANSRGRLYTASLFGVISSALVCVWVVCYYVFIYKLDTVFTGQGDP
jgi:hypothetical protein